MLKDRVANAVARQLTVVSAEMDQRLAVACNDLSAQFVQAGSFGAGRQQVLAVGLIAKSLESRAEEIWALLRKSAVAFGVRYYPDLADDVKALLQRYILAQHQHLSNFIWKVQPFSGVGGGRLPSVDYATPVDEARVQMQAWLDVEVDLWVAGLERATARPDSSGISVTGNSNILVVGNVNSPVSLTLSAEAKSAVEAAVAGLTAVLERNDLPVGIDAEGVRSLVRETTAEIRKAEPNVTRVRTFLFGIALTIQTLGEFKGAYELVRGALRLVGWELPPIP